MKISKKTENALYGALGVLGGYYVAKAIKFKEPILFAVAGNLVVTILRQPGELKRITS